MTNLESKAIEFAKKAHEGVTRKFSGLPYFDEHVSKVYESVKKDGGDESEICAALLHDTIEDVDWVTYDVILSEFGKKIADLVQELTSDEEKIKKLGKGPYLLDKMLHMSEKALNIKLRDRWCNILDLNTSSEKFRNKYYNETKFIIEGLSERELTTRQQKIINEINQILDSIKEKIQVKLKYIKTFESFKVNNITIDDIIKCIDNGGLIYSDIIKNYPDNDPKEPLRPVSVDNDGLVTIEINGQNYDVDIKNINRIEI
jgi:GTP pyrophosphokinase